MGLLDTATGWVGQGREQLGKNQMLNTTGKIPLRSMGGDFNVVTNYPWTLTPSKNRHNVPYIILREFEQDLATTYAQLAQVALNLQSSKTNIGPYESLYHAIPTGTIYTLPYFEEYDHNISPSWEKTKGLADTKVGAEIMAVVGNIAKMMGMAPGTYINQPRVWSGAQDGQYPIKFTLFNTLDAKDIPQNNFLKRRLQMSALHDQQSVILASPPAIFEVEIPGIRWSPAAVISNISVSNIGQVNFINGMNVPDAWEIQLTITELITESRQMLASTNTSEKIRAISQAPIPIVQDAEGADIVGVTLPVSSSAAMNNRQTNSIHGRGNAG